MASLLLDTCIVIDFLRRKPAAKEYIHGLDEIPYLSAVTVAELYSGVREGDERSKLDALIEAFHTISTTEEIGKQGGLYRRQYGKSHGVDLADALIAATAESIDAELVTLNKKHFPMMERLIVPYGQ